MKNVSFRAQISGDGECFCWNQVPAEDMKNLLGDQQYAENLQLEQEFYKETGNPPPATLDRLYPNDIWEIFGCKPGKTYHFTIQVEEDEKKSGNL